MNNLKSHQPLRLVLLWLGVFVYTGCSRPPAPPKKANTESGRETESPLDELRKAQTTSAFREALGKLNSEIASKAQLTSPQRDVLQQRFHFSSAEIKDIEAGTFQPLDANHVENCFFFREVARGLELAGLNQRQQVEYCFAWVARQILLQESPDHLLPPHVVLRLGRGTARDRALVFLALLQQFQIEGCLVALPGQTPNQPGPLVVGVLLGDKNPDVYLFDPRLGLPLPGPGGIATLAQLRKDPKLFWPENAPADVKGDFEIYLACPIQALAPRCKALEKLLGNQDKVALAYEPEAWLGRWEKMAGKVQVWNSPAKPGDPPSPFRALAAYLPVEEHGLDKNKSKRKDRVEGFGGQLFPVWPVVLGQYAQMGLLLDEHFPAPMARSFLLKFSWDLFLRYVAEPRSMLQRSQFEQVKLRVGVMHTPFNLMELETNLPERLVDFREKARKATQEFEKKKSLEPLNRLFYTDQFLLGLLDMRKDFDRNPQEAENRAAPEPLDPKGAGDPSFIILSAVKKPMQQELLFLQAQRWQEQAERAQAKLQSIEKGGENKQSVEGQWTDCIGSWNKFLSRAEAIPTPTDIQSRIRPRLQGNLEGFFTAMDHLFSELHKSFTARYYLARAKGQRGNTQEAIKEWQALSKDLADLEQRADFQQLFSDAQNLVQGRPAHVARVQAWQRDLGPQGGFAWLRRAALIAEKEGNPK